MGTPWGFAFAIYVAVSPVLVKLKITFSPSTFDGEESITIENYVEVEKLKKCEWISEIWINCSDR